MMRPYHPFIFNRFDCLVKKLNDEKNPYGSLVKLGKATDIEERYIKIYTRAMFALKQMYFYYIDIISAKIKYSQEMGTESTYRKRATTALKSCHFRACEIKLNFNTLISAKIPQRYKYDLKTLFELKEKRRAKRANL